MGAALAAALACCCAAQTTDFLPRLAHGEQLRLQDRYQEARTVFLNLLRDMRNDQSNQRLEALVEDNLGLDDQDRGDYAGAETAYNHGVDLLRGEPVYDSVMIDVKTHLAELYLAENRPRDAESLLREGRTDASHAPKPASMQLATLNEDLAVACIMRRKLSETEGLLREAQALVENTYGPDSPRLSSSLFSYAGLLVTEHKYDEAIPPAERAWHILAHSTLTIPKPYVASALSVMGMVYYHAGRLDQAEEYARKSVDLAEASLGARHPRVGLYLWNYALILRTAGRKNEAKAAQKKADAILDQPPSSSSGGYTVNVDSLR
ncbi:MAG TPA: tetratricopeptide repeat protein [Bryobacteraceae bacterium]|nr:tetratricopeptide repeat protein [Bryobacteraceae bacterium]